MYSEKIIQEFVNKLIKEKEGKCLDFKQKITLFYVHGYIYM